MTAEVVKHFFPKLVELHNYTPAHSTQQKLSNWSTLNRQVYLFSTQTVMQTPHCLSDPLVWLDTFPGGLQECDFTPQQQHWDLQLNC